MGEIRDERAIGRLINLLYDEDQWVWATASEALVKIGKPAVEPLLKVLDNPDIRRISVETIVKIGKSAVESLIKALKDTDWEVRCGAAEALGKIGDARAVEPLLKAMGDEDALVRRNAKEAVERICPATSEKMNMLIIKALENKDRKVRLYAADILEERGWKPANEKEIIVYYIAKQNWERLVEIGKPAVAALIRVLRDEDVEVRRRAAETLVRIGISVVELLIRTLDNRAADWVVRSNAAWILGEIKDAQAIKSLINALGDVNGGVQSEAGKALVKIGVSVVEPLITELNERGLDEEAALWSVRATEVLGWIGDARAFVPLKRMLVCKFEPLRRAVVEAMVNIDYERAMSAIISHLSSEDNRNDEILVRHFETFTHEKFRKELKGANFRLIGRAGVSIGVEIEVGNDPSIELRTKPTNQFEAFKGFLEDVVEKIALVDNIESHRGYYWNMHFNIGLSEAEGNRIVVGAVLGGELWKGVKDLVHMLMYANNPLRRNEWNLTRLYLNQLYYYKTDIEHGEGRDEVGRLEIKEASIGAQTDIEYLLWAGEFLKKVIGEATVEKAGGLVSRAREIYRAEGLYLTGSEGIYEDRARLEEMRIAGAATYYQKCEHVRRKLRRGLGELMGMEIDERNMTEESSRPTIPPPTTAIPNPAAGRALQMGL